MNLAEKLGAFGDHWRPRLVAELNGQHVKLVKFQGEFVWHHHAAEDELFFVLRGRFRMDYRSAAVERSVWLEEGEMLVVPRGVEHRPVAEEEVAVMLFEPASTVNTGNVQSDRTVQVGARLTFTAAHATGTPPGREAVPAAAATARRAT